ncbi:MAG: diacylglycerol kinase family protein [Ruminococcaceae bacterium]|nr:diacylglycerol kinase family protein [Oscillospiraceae bacterium]
MKFVLYNPYSGGGAGKTLAASYLSDQAESYEIMDITEISSYADFFEGINEDDEIIIFGGDGTLNRFVNDTYDVSKKCPIYYYPSGTGNDFYAEVKPESETKEPILITEYLENTPSVTVKGNTYKFINGVGYGIDGYCCEVGDKLHAEGKSVNYTSIAIKGLLFHYKPVNAKVIVDGIEYNYKKVWIAPCMNGKYYGGGMIPAPEQKRGSGELSLMVFHGSGKLKTLMIFPGIFKGAHVKHEKQVTVHKGRDITVIFDEPRALQVDGETILEVEQYHATI